MINKTALIGHQMGLNPVVQAFTKAGWTVKRGHPHQGLTANYTVCIFWAASWSQYQPTLDKLRANGVKVIYAELAWLPQSRYIYLDSTGTGAKSQSLSSLDISKPLTPVQSDWLDSQLNIYRTIIKPGARTVQTKSPFVLAPLQTDRDINIREWSPISNMANFIKFLSQIQGVSVYAKPHPRRFSKHSPASAVLQTEMKVESGVNILPDQCDLKTLICDSSAVVTINSCVGIEAMVWDKPVITLGQSFFSRPDIATQYVVSPKEYSGAKGDRPSYPIAVRKMMNRKGIPEVNYEEPAQIVESRTLLNSTIQQAVKGGVTPEMQENRRRWLFHLCERQLPIEAFQEDDIIERILSGDFKQRWHGSTSKTCGIKSTKTPDKRLASSAQVQV